MTKSFFPLSCQSGGVRNTPTDSAPEFKKGRKKRLSNRILDRITEEKER